MGKLSERSDKTEGKIILDKDIEIILSEQECRCLIDLIRQDIVEWQQMRSRPIEEVGLLFDRLAKKHISSMKILSEKFEAIYS